jgi:ubiquinone/menaquinone biosynthesis C-methylase UbiE
MKKNSNEIGFSHSQAIERFSREKVATRYPARFEENDHRDQREKQAILKGLVDMEKGAAILDLPCGTGRVCRVLIDQGFQIMAADSSESMLNLARENIRSYLDERGKSQDLVQFMNCDVMSTGFADNTFDGVVCSRLFHHFNEAKTRRLALTELNRICQGPMIVSFFNAFSLDAVYGKIRNFVRGHVPTDRIPISLDRFNEDAKAAGLKIKELIPVRWPISTHCYIVFERR